MITNKQTNAFKLLFELRGDDAEVRKKLRISEKTWYGWLNDPDCITLITNRIVGIKLKTRIIISSYGTFAAAKLVELTQCERPNVARAASRDLLQLIDFFNEPEKAALSNPEVNLTPDEASALLDALAKAKAKTAAEHP